jgi:hypothetical protein
MIHLEIALKYMSRERLGDSSRVVSLSDKLMYNICLH